MDREKLGGILEQNFRFIKKLLGDIGICILYLLSNIKKLRPFFPPLITSIFDNMSKDMPIPSLEKYH